MDQNTWIYMSSEIKQVAFLAPEEVNRELLVIKFDTEDKVISIQKLQSPTSCMATAVRTA